MTGSASKLVGSSSDFEAIKSSDYFRCVSLFRMRSLSPSLSLFLFEVILMKGTLRYYRIVKGTARRSVRIPAYPVFVKIAPCLSIVTNGCAISAASSRMVCGDLSGRSTPFAEISSSLNVLLELSPRIGTYVAPNSGKAPRRLRSVQTIDAASENIYCVLRENRANM